MFDITYLEKRRRRQASSLDNNYSGLRTLLASYWLVVTILASDWSGPASVNVNVAAGQPLHLAACLVATALWELGGNKM